VNKFILKKVDEAEGEVVKKFKFQGKDVEIRKGQKGYEIVPNVFPSVIRNTWSVVFSSAGLSFIRVNFVYNNHYFAIKALKDDIKELDKIYNQIERQIGLGQAWQLSGYVTMGLENNEVS